jgi:nitrite reductase/ring-hydroxylating ferredoxin subunit
MSKHVLVGDVSEFPAGQCKSVHVEGATVLVAQVDQQFYAVANQCPHLGLPLAGGKLNGATLTCPWHNSTFDLRTGQNLDWVPGVAGLKMPGWVRSLVALGKQPHGVRTYPTAVKDGKLYVEL